MLFRKCQIFKDIQIKSKWRHVHSIQHIPLKRINLFFILLGAKIKLKECLLWQSANTIQCILSISNSCNSINNTVKIKQAIKNQPINIKAISEILKEVTHIITVIAETKTETMLKIVKIVKIGVEVDKENFNSLNKSMII